MEFSPVAARPIRRPIAAPVAEADRRGVRLPAGADSKLFGGWGVRF
jgi:hypothetical protein